jgi:ribosomal protein S18 acetylase RimI-like enzyme
MEEPGLRIVPYRPEYEHAVVQLWHDCNLTRPWNDPARDIRRMMTVYPDLFLIGLLGDRVITTVMGGYDGHRGWLYYLGVAPDHRHRGYARLMVDAVTVKLKALGCPKINIQVRGDNTAALGFYEKLGYTTEDRVSIAKRLVEDGQNRVQ